MENIKIYNQDGNVAGETEAPKFLASNKWNTSLIHQVFKAMAANKRKPIAHTKTRGEVSGGGIKPWRQKGTGRARHGSIRSPIWRHGGVTFGPRNTTDFSQKINRKMLKKALLEALAKKYSLNQLKVIKDLEINPKTKELNRVMTNLIGQKTALLAVSGKNKNVFRAANNLAKIKALPVKNLNVYDVLNHQFVLLDQTALQELNNYAVK